MKHPARILFVNPAAGFSGGAERSLLDLVCGLDRARFDPAVVCPGEGELATTLRDAGVRVHCIAWPRQILQMSRQRPFLAAARSAAALLSGIPFLSRLRKLIRKDACALICTNGIKAHLMGAAAGFGIAPVIWHFRDYPTTRIGRAFFCLGGTLFPARIITPSDLVGRVFNTSAARRKQITIHNGIRPEAFRDVERGRIREAREQLGLEHAGPVLGSIGGLVRIKGFDVLLRSLPRVLERFPGASLLIVGGQTYMTDVKDERQRLEALAQKLGVRDRIVFAGFRKDTPVMLRLMDVVVQATVIPEALPRVLLEAMASGRPVIGSVPGGASEIIRHGETGLLVPSGDPAALAEAIVQLLAHPEETAGMVRSAGDEVATRFSLGAMIRQIETLFDQTVRRGNGEKA